MLRATGHALVKPARLHFARTARALTGRYINMCERGVVSEFSAARAHAGLTGLTSHARMVNCNRGEYFLKLVLNCRLLPLLYKTG